MPDAPQVDLPKPVPLHQMPAPPIPEHVLAKPGIVAVVSQSPESRSEIALVAKRTLIIQDDGFTRPAQEQLPLTDDYVLHDPLPDGSKGSIKGVPEALGYRSGTDVIIRAHARPARAARQAAVSVRIGSYLHRAVVFGDRHVDEIQDRIVFSDPAPFEKIPLRYELAYGGQDDVLRDERLAALQAAFPPDVWRNSAAFFKDSTDGMPGIAYPRNRFGRGYVVLDRPARLVGLKLPNIEFPDDLLTPQRLVVGARENWHRQPVPAGFDFLEPGAFPRTAMMGAPPTKFDYDSAAEVKRGQVPKGYCRGNLMEFDPSKASDIVNMEFVRCAAIGLRFGFLRGGETIVLSGMRHDLPEWAVQLPATPPELNLRYDNEPLAASAQLHQVLIDVDARRMELLWVARFPVRRVPTADETVALANQVKVQWREGREQRPSV